MKKICGNCQYYRGANFLPSISWPTCSNSESEYAMYYIKKTNSCKQFYRRGKKAPLAMRIAAKVLSGK